MTEIQLKRLPPKELMELVKKQAESALLMMDGHPTFSEPWKDDGPVRKGATLCFFGDFELRARFNDVESN